MKGCKYCLENKNIHYSDRWNVGMSHSVLTVWNYENQISHINIPINFCLNFGRRLRKGSEYEWGKCKEEPQA